MKFRKRLESMLNKMSYTARRTYAVTKYTEKCNRYLLMDEPEFLMDYIEAIAKYHESKFTFIASEFSTIAILFISLYKYIFFLPGCMSVFLPNSAFGNPNFRNISSSMAQ